MLTAEAVIQTDHADRYLARLGQHAGKMGRQPGHRPRRHGSGEPPEVRHAEWSGTHGKVRLNWGQWTVDAAPGRLTLRAEAADQASLQQIQDMLTTRLEKFGWREHLTVSWQPRRAPSASPASQPKPRGRPSFRPDRPGHLSVSARDTSHSGGTSHEVCQ